eukprot:scaffold14600_cov150-Skeletonema_dohrnii-CCMP3373.AAC.5
MGRKRNQGKARKAAKVKAREEAEEERGNDNNQAINWQQSLTAQMSNNNNAPTAGNDTIKMTCRHGFKIFDSVSLQFATAFREAFYESAKDGGANVLICLEEAEYATKDKFADVWNDSTKMEIAMSYFLFNGTRNILEGSNDVARDCAVFARCIEQYIAIELHQTQALVNFPKLIEIYNPSDVHTLVKFFRKRIPCSCLDDKYDEVKAAAKMGLCFNLQCNLPDRMVERKKTMYCSRCRSVTYCSPECQKAHWKLHKAVCDRDAAKRAEFDAKQQN